MSAESRHLGQQSVVPRFAALSSRGVRIPAALYALFALVTVGIIVGGFFFNRAQERQLRQNKEDEVWTVAQLKAKLIESWRAERLGDASIISHSPLVEPDIAGWLANPDDGAAEGILAHFRRLRQHYHYSDVLVVDVNGRVRLSLSGEKTALGEESMESLKVALRTHEPVLSDLRFHLGDVTPRMDVIAPIQVGKGVGRTPVGAVVLVVDAREFLYPMLYGWPLPRLSPETLLVRSEGEDLLVLNDLNSQSNTAFRLKIPWPMAVVPPEASAPHGEKIFEGRDYRGIEVLSAIASVPDSPWLLVAEMDADEVLADMRWQTRLIIALVVGLLSATVAAVALLRQRMLREHFRTAYEAEVALRQSEANTEAMLEAMPDLMCRLSGDGVYLEFHVPSTEQFYLDSQEFLGKRVDEVLPLEVGEAYQLHIRTALETGKTQVFEYHLDLPEGERYFETRMAVCGNNEALTIVRNITGRKRDEEEIQHLLAQVRQDAAELENRVAERTAQLKEANAELETFAYSVSHDLKAPLRGINGYSELLEKDYADRLDNEGLLFIRNIRAGAAQMNQLIEDLLGYSRMERRALQSVILNLPALVQAVVAERTAEVERAGIQLRMEIPLITVRADRDGLATVLRNLLDNAVKFSREARPPTVEIGARVEGERAILWVRDNGIGFDMKFQDRIFEIFQRLQRTEEYPGTGIGLALVRKAMQRMGGRAWAESAPGEGATFFLEMPL